MPKEDWEVEDAVDPGEPPVEPPVVAADGGEVEDGSDEGFPDAQLIIDENTGQHYLAFEIEPQEESDENEEKK